MAQVEAQYLEADSVYTDRSGTMWMVRAVTSEKQGIVSALLSAGRTDPGHWETFKATEIVDMYRSRK